MVGMHKTTWLTLSAVMLVQVRLNAQSDARSTILGRVTDPAGGAIVAATVRAENADTGVRSTAVTNATGDFLLPFLKRGVRAHRY